MKKSKEIVIGISILIIGSMLGVISAIGVVESTMISSASNDGWLGFLGGLIGSLLSGIVTFYILYLNRKETREIQNKQYKQIEYQNRKQFADNIAELVSVYLSDICAFFYTQYYDEEKLEEQKKEVDRRISINKYFELNIKLKGIASAHTVLLALDKIHNKYCYYIEGQDRLTQRENFENSANILQKEVEEFVLNYKTDII